MTATPAVSVLVTTYRHARFVRESLESLRAQTSRDFETIITDDASDDGTADVIQAWLDETGFPARFIRNPVNRGICANRNAALALATGRFICSLAGDDAYVPDRIERQLACFLELPADVAAVYGDVSLMDAESRDLGISYIRDKLGDESPPAADALFRKLLLDECFLPAPAVMVRRSALDAVGPYDESLFFEDLFMWLKLSHRFRFHHLPASLVRYRKLETSMSRGRASRAAMLESSFRVLNAWRGSCGDAEAALNERLWSLAFQQLQTGDYASARRMMSELATTDGKLRRRMVAYAATLPGGCAALRGVDRALQVARGGVRSRFLARDRKS